MVVSLGPAAGRHQKRRVILGLFALLVLMSVALPLVWPTRGGKQEFADTQITAFTYSAVSPAMSPDCKMLAFLRSDISS
jgi:hypothetical protein